VVDVLGEVDESRARLGYLLGGGVDDMVNGLHGEIEGHKLNDRAETLVCGSSGEAGKAHFCNIVVNIELIDE
jgi:hypothetical protein